MYGFLNLNKPLGVTSHDCVAKVRRLLRLKRVGHAGTLDPLASGVLPIAVGSATRLLQFLPSGKAYQARIRLGQVSTTDDLEGEVLASTPAPDLTLETVQAVLPKFLGRIQQVPPLFSAIHVEGKRLYKRAIAGETPDIPPRTVEIFDLQVLDWQPGDFPVLEVAIACGSGTYIRAIARDLGQVLGCGGTLAGLIRTASSGFDLSMSITFEDLATQIEAGCFQLASVDHAIGHLPRLELPSELAYRWCLGQTVPCPTEFTMPLEASLRSPLDLPLKETLEEPTQPSPELRSPEPIIIRLYDPQQNFLGLAQILDSGETVKSLRPKVVLAAPQNFLENAP